MSNQNKLGAFSHVLKGMSKLVKAVGSGLLIFLFAGFFTNGFAQSASVIGQVYSASADGYISGSEITLEGNDYSEKKYAEAEGRFSFSELNAGTYTLTVRHRGYESAEFEITLAENETLIQDVELQSDETFTNNFVEQIHVNKVNRFGDYSIQDALARLPGVQVARQGEINIRGAGHNTYNLTLNGQRLVSTGLGYRQYHLGSISTDAIRDLELIKVVTPDMDADAVAGVINLNTSQAAGSDRKLSARAAGGLNSTYLSLSGPESRAWVNYAERFQDVYSIAVTMSYQNEKQAWEELGLSYGLANFGNGPVDVVEQVSPSLHTDDRGRFGASLDFQYDPSSNEHYFIRGFFSDDNLERVSHTDSWTANGDWIDQLTTGEEGGMGVFSHHARQQNLDIIQSSVQAGAEHNLESLDLTYSAGWSQSISNNLSYLFPFQLDGFNLAVDWEQRNRPSITPTNRATQIMEDGSIDRRFMIGQDIERIVEEHVGNEVTARVDVNLPFTFGALKAGGSARLSYKDGEYDENFFEYNRTLRMIGFNMLREPNRNIEVIDGNYMLPWLTNTNQARAFFENQRPVFTGDEYLNRALSDVRNYKATEHIYAGYGMANLEFGSLQLTGGARVEFSNNEYEGNYISFDEAGDFGGSERVTEFEDAIRLFPHAQIAFDATDRSSIHMAYSRTINRPDFYLLTPFQNTNHFDSTIYRGNPQLDPISSDNLDLKFQQTFDHQGKVTLGAFYKKLNNFIVEREQDLSGEFDGYQERFFENGDESATIYGAEVAWQQRLSFLPGFLNNMGVFANYTWSASEFDTNRDDDTALPGQSPHVVNAALDYEIGRFFTQISYHWSAEYISRLAQNRRSAPAVSSTGEVYMDQYREGYQDFSIYMNYTLSPYFQLWANIKNLLPNERLEYAYDRELYQTNTYMREGLDLRLGVRFDL